MAPKGRPERGAGATHRKTLNHRRHEERRGGDSRLQNPERAHLGYGIPRRFHLPVDAPLPSPLPVSKSPALGFRIQLVSTPRATHSVQRTCAVPRTGRDEQSAGARPALQFRDLVQRRRLVTAAGDAKAHYGYGLAARIDNASVSSGYDA
ncbi:hypothetical protein XA68_13009 [Ophiocordyceps unilateralis]|uniref:Uncharacterized protein n=1 Tax=Ophiocordyceps unilateralis TaxID=268505 RepID=A0A2A9PMJ9_OPHUN|nr:hypothetical protein XA68_13009 [Ophiocordyceps unilateralis]